MRAVGEQIKMDVVGYLSGESHLTTQCARYERSGMKGRAGFSAGRRPTRGA